MRERTTASSGWAAGSLIGTWVLVAGPAGLYCLLDNLFPDLSGFQQSLLAACCGTVPVVALAALALGWSVSPEQARKLSIYAEFVGVPIDVARLRRQAGVRDRIVRQMLQRARGLTAQSYRSAYLPETEWAQMALDDQVRDAPFLRSALTLSRLDAALASGPRRKELAQVHQAIWHKLSALEAPQHVTQECVRETASSG